MISYSFIEGNIIDCRSDELPDNLVGAAMVSNKDGSHHAAIFIRYNGNSHVFHFTGKQVLMEDVWSIDEVYYHVGLNIINPILLPSFQAQCELILEKAEPKFGYFYTGAVYNESGDFVSPNDFPQYMTCVGFCLSTISGFLSDSIFFNFEDWDDALIDETFVERFLEKVKAENPEVDTTSFKENIRRILPIDYMSGAFSMTTPITKSFVDQIKTDVLVAFQKKQVA